jgi:hypothetical protein
MFMKHHPLFKRGKTFLLALSLCLLTAATLAQSVPTANSFSSFRSYTRDYSYGINPGYYGGNWTTRNLATIAMGDTMLGVKGTGSKSLRVALYDEFLTTWGLNSLLGDYQYFNSVGAGEITAFVGHPHSTHQLDSTFEGASEKSHVFKGMYDPIWLDSAQTQINSANTYAKYLYDAVNTYGPYVKFWEIVNEPDFTYSAGGWSGDMEPPLAGSWFDQNPTPDELTNLKAPVFYYIRLLRISWEVIKKLQPDDYVCTGGLGYRSFLDALLRNTDNPVDGSVTAEYPLKAGAYFDILSFHNYPMYALKRWSNEISGFEYFRHSDAAVQAFINSKNSLDSVCRLYGSNGVTYPKKQIICTETGIPGIMDNDNWGSNEGQKNYLIKVQVASQKTGIKQLYWYQLGDQANPNAQWDQYGLYSYFGNTPLYNAKLTDAGMALKTTSDLLYGKTYDSTRTAALNLPSTVDGGAFKAGGNYVYVLWAKTNTDLSETATATYSFPTLIKKNNMYRREWNFSDADTSIIVSKLSVKLSGSPSFFTETNVAVNQNPRVNAGADQIITSSVDSIQLTGSATDADGTISSYKWTQLSGPPGDSIVFPNQPKTMVKKLVPGIYTFRSTATDNKGGTGIDDVTITLPVILPAKIEAEAYTSMNGIQTESTADEGGGLNVGYIDNGDWLEYSFYAPVAGTYSVTLRLASPNDGSQLQIKNQEGTVFSTVDVPNTGLYQGWQSVSTTIPLEKGIQTIRIQSSNYPNWNINWLDLIVDSSSINQLPVANAGADQTITLPDSTIQLEGSGTDTDGSIVSYNWTKVSGPVEGSFSDTAIANPTVMDLVGGVYIFRLTVTDNKGATATDDVTVTVNATPPPPNQTPGADAGADQTITLPTNGVTLSGTGTDADGTIVKNSWSKISGPAQGTITDSTSASTTVTGLGQGTYVFRLTVTDNGGAMATDDVTIIVNPQPKPEFSLKIEAEAYAVMSGVQVETTKDTTGAQDVTAINDNDWMEYPVNVLYAGTYTVNFRIASTKAGTKFQLRKADGTILTTMNVPNTGGAQIWQTLGATVTLNQGQQNLRIYATRVAGILNINWWELILTNASATSTTSITQRTTAALTEEETVQNVSSVSLYPNPVHDYFVLELNNGGNGPVKVQIFNTSGVLQKEFTVTKASGTSRTNVPIHGLPPGSYFVKISINDWSELKKIIKQ